MWGSTIPTEYYGFYCDPHLQKFYWVMVISPGQPPSVRSFKADNHPRQGHYIAGAASSPSIQNSAAPNFVPIEQLCTRRVGYQRSFSSSMGSGDTVGTSRRNAWDCTGWVLWLFSIWLALGFMQQEYVLSFDVAERQTDTHCQFPEASYPYTFDIFGGSHQIFHIMVILAGLAHMVGLLQAFDYTHASGLQCGKN